MTAAKTDPSRPELPPGLPEDHGLGDFRGLCGRVSIPGWISHVSMLIFACALVMPFIKQAPADFRFLAGVVATVLAAMLIVITLVNRALSYRYVALFRDGFIRRLGRKSFRVHRYDAAGQLSWLVAPIVVNGMTLGMQFLLKVVEDAGGKLKFSGQLGPRAVGFEAMREGYADAIARRLLPYFAEEKELPLGDRLVLYPEALGVHRSASRARKGEEPERRIPYAELDQTLEPERLVIIPRAKGEKKLKLRRTGWNFEPAYLVFQTLHERAREVSRGEVGGEASGGL